MNTRQTLSENNVIKSFSQKMTERLSDIKKSNDTVCGKTVYELLNNKQAKNNLKKI